MRKLSAVAGLTLAASSIGMVRSVHALGDDDRRAPRFTAIATFDTAAQEIPESITTDHLGNLYISVGNTIRRRTPDGTISVFATLPAPIFALGVKVGRDGCVYNVSSSLSDVPGAFVWKACAPNAIELVAELDQSGGPNDLAFDDDDNLYVTDPVLGQVWKLDAARNVSVWAEDELLTSTPDDPALIFRALGVNGIAFSEDHRFLYFSNTDRGTILRARVRRSGSPEIRVFAADTRLRGADGIAFDRDGTLFVNVNVSDTLATVNPGGHVRILAQGGLLDAPSSAVFGATEADRHLLYVSSSAFSRTLGLQPGTPHPALLETRVDTPGVRLP
jgi:sugar lactone lactonase YvrE